MPRLKSETIGVGDQSWLGSTHAMVNARTETVDISAFSSSTHYPNGYIPSGTPVAKVGGKLVPYDPTEGTTTGAGVLAGFLLTDCTVVGSDDFAAPLFWHGAVRVANLPVSFSPPAASAKQNPRIDFI